MSAFAQKMLCSLLAGLLAISPAVGLLGGGCLLSTTSAFPSFSALTPQPLGYSPAPPKGPVVGVHIALEDEKTVRVNWMNPAPPSSGHFQPQCQYGATAANLSFVVNGFFYSYTAGLFNHTLNSAYLDLTVLPCTPSLSPCNKPLYYRCGDKGFGWSDVFHVLVQDSAVPLTPGPQIAVIGDMGTPHGQATIDAMASRTLTRVRSKTTAANNGSGIQLLLHAGDITYADHFNNEQHNNSWVWVDYMDKLQAVAAHVPYMTAPGNHEAEFSFAAYLNWLPMPTKASGSNSPYWYSFDYLGVHVTTFSTEHDFSPNSTQHQWIEQDLKRANANRERVPWIVVMGHRPLYCSSIVCRERCKVEAAKYRSYLEDMLYQQRVDVVLVGHIHHYERSYPVYRNQPTQKNYINPKAPVHIVNGAAGNPELNDPTFEPSVPWRAGDEMTFKTGFLLMMPSKNQLAVQYVMSKENDVVDSFTIVRT